MEDRPGRFSVTALENGEEVFRKADRTDDIATFDLSTVRFQGLD